MRAIVIRPGRPPVAAELDGGALRGAVGPGRLASLALASGARAYVADSDLADGVAPEAANVVATAMARAAGCLGRGRSVLGTMVVCGVAPDGSDADVDAGLVESARQVHLMLCDGASAGTPAAREG